MTDRRVVKVDNDEAYIGPAWIAGVVFLFEAARRGVEHVKYVKVGR